MNLRKLFIVTALFFGTSGYVNASNNAFANASADAVIEPNYNTPGILFANAILASYGIEGRDNGKVYFPDIPTIKKSIDLDVTQYSLDKHPSKDIKEWRSNIEYLIPQLREILFTHFYGRDVDAIVKNIFSFRSKEQMRHDGYELITHTGGLFEVVRGAGSTTVLVEHKNLKSIELLIVDSSFSIFFGMISPNCLLFNLVITQDSSKYLLKNNIILDTGKIVLR